MPYSVVDHLYSSFSGLITSLGEERANFMFMGIKLFC